jgi:hypothetical protein
MDLSLRRLEQAVSIRRQIDALERRFSGLVGGGRATTSAGKKTGGGRRSRTMSAATRAKIAAAARRRWARVRGKRKAGGKGRQRRGWPTPIEVSDTHRPPRR